MTLPGTNIVQIWRVGGPPLVVLGLAFGFMLGGHFEGSLGLIGSALVVFMVTLSADVQRRDHKRCLDELIEVRQSLDRQGRYMARFRQALMRYLVSKETIEDKKALLDEIGRGLEEGSGDGST